MPTFEPALNHLGEPMRWEHQALADAINSFLMLPLERFTESMLRDLWSEIIEVADRWRHITKKGNTMSTSLTTIVSDFQGHALTTIEYKGKPAWIAREVGAAIGYAQSGRRFAGKVTGEWSEEMVEGKDYLIISGDELKWLKRVASLDTDSVSSRAPSITLLLESGLHMALVKTSKPAGRKLRRFLVDEVLPRLARGQSIPAPEQPPPIDFRLERERRLADAQALKLRKTRAQALERLASLHADRVDPDVVLMLRTRAQCELLGEDPPAVLAIEDKQAAWLSPTQIAQRFDVTPNRIGRTISALKLKGEGGAGIEGISKAVLNKSQHSDRTVTSYLYSEDAITQIRAALVKGNYISDPAA